MVKKMFNKYRLFQYMHHHAHCLNFQGNDMVILFLCKMCGSEWAVNDNKRYDP